MLGNPNFLICYVILPFVVLVAIAGYRGTLDDGIFDPRVLKGCGVWVAGVALAGLAWLLSQRFGVSEGEAFGWIVYVVGLLFFITAALVPPSKW